MDYLTTYLSKGAEAYSPPMALEKLHRTYPHLKGDPIHEWRAIHGVELIHKEPTKEELKRILGNWKLMSDEQKALSEARSMELFGKTNLQHAEELLGKEAAVAKGIPDRSVMSDPAALKAGELYDWLVHEHEAKRAGLHYDLRVGGPEGLHSWAVRKGMPARGEKRLAVLQPLHDYEYRKFKGTIPEGYGAGKVTIADKGSVLVTKVGDGDLSFVIADKRYPETFKMIKTGGNNWLLMNTTPVNYATLDKNPKPKYTIVGRKEAEALMDGMHAVSAKIDGASALVEVLGDKIEAVSYRKGADDRIISYAHKMGLTGIKPNPSLKGTVLRAEVFGERNGKAIPAQELSGLLNATIARSKAAQKARDINMKAAVFDVVSAPGYELATYRDRLDAMKKIQKMLPADKFMQAPVETDPAKARQMLNTIEKGKYPLTAEGVVITELDKPGAIPAKMKMLKDYDVAIRNIFEAETKSAPRAGGFEYSMPDNEEVVGRVGTGFTHDTLKDMLKNPDKYIGRTARVSALEQYPSGALRAPAYLSLHEDV